jgi:hypothetical protein
MLPCPLWVLAMWEHRGSVTRWDAFLSSRETLKAAASRDSVCQSNVHARMSLRLQTVHLMMSLSRTDAMDMGAGMSRVCIINFYWWASLLRHLYALGCHKDEDAILFSHCHVPGVPRGPVRSGVCGDVNWQGPVRPGTQRTRSYFSADSPCLKWVALKKFPGRGVGGECFLMALGSPSMGAGVILSHLTVDDIITCFSEAPSSRSWFVGVGSL